VPPTGGGSVTAVISSPGSSAVSMCGVSPGRRWNSAMGMRGVRRRLHRFHHRVQRPHGHRHVARVVAMQASLVPTTASWRLKPPMAEQPLPGWRLLQGWLVS
jgi:hypothetical protein